MIFYPIIISADYQTLIQSLLLYFQVNKRRDSTALLLLSYGLVSELSHSLDFDDIKKKGLETNLFNQEELFFDEKKYLVDDFDQNKIILVYTITKHFEIYL